VASAAIALTLILFLGFGVLGFLLGMLAGAFLASIIGWWSIRSWLDFSHLHTHWWPRLLKFGSPLIPVGMAMYVLNTADRWFIKYHHDERALGLYALASKFAALVAMAITTFRQAWWPIAMDALQSESGPRVYRTIARIYICVGVCCIVLLTASSPYLVRLFATPEYYQSYSVIGILAWSSVFYGFYLIGSGGIWKAEKTIVAPILAGGAALLNIGLNAWFVPEHGYMGAALATTLSFLLWNIFTVIVSEHLWRVNLPYGLFSVQIIVGSGVCYLIHMTYDAGEPFWKVGILSGVCIAVLAALSVNRKEYKIVGKWISERLRRYHWKREKLYK
jgi:O-antigen/teichoic acid export membrane protein